MAEKRKLKAVASDSDDDSPTSSPVVRPAKVLRGVNDSGSSDGSSSDDDQVMMKEKQQREKELKSKPIVDSDSEDDLPLSVPASKSASPPAVEPASSSSESDADSESYDDKPAEKAKPKKAKAKARAPKTKPAAGSGDETRELEPTEGKEERSAFDREWEEIVNATKTKRRTKDLDDEIVMDEYCSKIYDSMVVAARADAEAIESGQPASFKLTVLPALKGLTAKTEYHDAALEQKIVYGIKDFLEPVGIVIPSLAIRKVCYELLAALPIQRNHLLNTKIGPLIHMYTKHPREKTEWRIFLEKLIQRWAAPLLARSRDFRDRVLPVAERVNQLVPAAADVHLPSGGGRVKGSPQKRAKSGGVFQTEAPVPAAAAADGDAVLKPVERVRASIPRPSFKNYGIMPSNMVNEEEADDKRDTDLMKRLKQKMNKLKTRR